MRNSKLTDTPSNTSLPTTIDYLITGGTGLIGRHFISSLPDEAVIVVLSRQQQHQVVKQIHRPVFVISSLSQIPSSSIVKVAINLSGEPIVDRPWTSNRKRILRESRVGITKQLAALSNSLPEPIDCLLTGSAIGYYGSNNRNTSNEESALGADFGAHLCEEWEQASKSIAARRRVVLRTSIVLSQQGGMIAKLLPSYRLGLGSWIGSGNQKMSWIHIDDMVDAMKFLIDMDSAQGSFNMSSPTSVTNKDFSKRLAHALNRHCRYGLPATLVKSLFGLRSDLLLGNQDVFPQRLSDLGYSFKYKDIEKALPDLVKK